MKLFVVLTLQEGFESLSESIAVEVYQAPSETDLIKSIKREHEKEGFPSHFFDEFMSVSEVQEIQLAE